MYENTPATLPFSPPLLFFNRRETGLLYILSDRSGELSYLTVSRKFFPAITGFFWNMFTLCFSHTDFLTFSNPNISQASSPLDRYISLLLQFLLHSLFSSWTYFLKFLNFFNFMSHVWIFGFRGW